MNTECLRNLVEGLSKTGWHIMPDVGQASSITKGFANVSFKVEFLSTGSIRLVFGVPKDCKEPIFGVNPGETSSISFPDFETMILQMFKHSLEKKPE